MGYYKLRSIMKSLFALFALILTCNSTFGQTLRWTYTLTDPTSFPQNIPEVYGVATDALGNFCVALLYNAHDIRILWLSSHGKVLRDAEIPQAGGFQGLFIIHVSSNYLLVALGLSAPGSNNYVLRRYQRRNGIVKETDLALDRNEDPFGGDNANHDALGFFVFGRTDMRFLTTIKRYTFK